jgi:cation diffusion facilitator CzcD-associated flavoprotein CzcO
MAHEVLPDEEWREKYRTERERRTAAGPETRDAEGRPRAVPRAPHTELVARGPLRSQGQHPLPHDGHEKSWSAVGRWHLRVDRGDYVRRRFVILANGTVSQPKIPVIPGCWRSLRDIRSTGAVGISR